MTEDLPDWGWGARLPKAARHQMLHPSASERVGRRLVTQSKSDSSKRHFLAHLGKIAAPETRRGKSLGGPDGAGGRAIYSPPPSAARLRSGRTIGFIWCM